MFRVFWMRNRLSGLNTKAVLLVLLSTFVIRGSPSDKPDFLILGNPSSLPLLNQFQQPLSNEEKAALLPNTPFEIVQENRTLGDGLTEGSKLKLGTDVYYLIKAGKSAVKSGESYRRKFVDGNGMGDTVIVAKNAAVTLYSRYPSDGDVTVAPDGSELVRIFGYQELFYVRLLGPKARYGWCALNSHALAAARNSAEATLATGFDHSLVNRVEARMNSVNQKYREYF